MAEPTLTLNFTDLRNRVAFYLGKGTDYTQLDAAMQARVEFCVQNGLRRFYYPVIGDGGDPERFETYQWSFLHPRSTLSLVNATSMYQLPDDYGGGIQEFTLAGQNQKPIRVIPEPALRAMSARDTTTGVPLYAAIRAKKDLGASASNRYEAVFYPTPNASFTAEYTYAINPDKLTNSLPYPYGAAQHGQTLLRLCLSEAEQLENDSAGMHSAEARILLQASIQQDRKLREDIAALPWPRETAMDASLGVSYPELQREVGLMLNLGANPLIWTHDQFELVDSIIQDGIRQFYTPPPVPIARWGHEWSFLRPVGTVTTVAGTGDYELPDGFIGLHGDLTFQPNEGCAAVTVTGEQQIRKLRQQLSGVSNGRPRYAAVRPKASDGAANLKHEILFWPIPDKAYTLTYENVTPAQRLTAANPYPLGGVKHADTIKASVLDMAERKSPGGGKGVHHQVFLERLAASILADRKQRSAEYMGVSINATEGYEDWSGRALSIEYVGGDVNPNTRLTAVEKEQADTDAFLAQAWGGAPGVLRNAGDTFLKVVANTTPNMGAKVNPGLAFVQNADGTVGTARLSAEYQLVTFIAPTSQPRRDTVQINAKNDVTVKTGAESGAPSAPAVDAGYYKLAEIHLRPGMTSIKNTDDTVNGYIIDTRSFV